jgi:hypothetical protein
MSLELLSESISRLTINCSDIHQSPIPLSDILFGFLRVHAYGCPFLFAYRAQFFFRYFHNVINVKANVPSSSEVLQ